MLIGSAYNSIFPYLSICIHDLEISNLLVPQCRNSSWRTRAIPSWRRSMSLHSLVRYSKSREITNRKRIVRSLLNGLFHGWFIDIVIGTIVNELHNLSHLILTPKEEVC